jgi:hypothetical protein
MALTHGGTERSLVSMEHNNLELNNFQPETYCLRCQHMQWDEGRRCCANFCQRDCPLPIKSLLAGLEVTCMVV